MYDTDGWLVVIVLSTIGLILCSIGIYENETHQKNKTNENFNTKYEIVKDVKLPYRSDTVYVKAKTDMDNVVVLSNGEIIHIDSVISLIKNNGRK